MQPMSLSGAPLPLRQSWSIEDLAELPDEDWRRYEILDGALIMSPSSSQLHEVVSEELRALIRVALPAGHKVIGPVGLDLRSSYRIPDLVVMQMSAFDPTATVLRAADVVLVVEIVAPGSVTTDRVTKPAQYAAAGIGAYWRVETDPISLTAYALPAGGSVYAEVGGWVGGDTARLQVPFPVEIPISALAPPA